MAFLRNLQEKTKVYFNFFDETCFDKNGLNRGLSLRPARTPLPVRSPAVLTCRKGAEAIQLGKANVTLCAGTENMSSAPLVVSGNDAR